jgi:hypothetical protein
MPIPTTIDELDPVAANNSPAGTEEVGTDMDNYIRALSSFIAQLYGIVDGPYVYENLSSFRAYVTSGQVTSFTDQPVAFTSRAGSTDYSTSTYKATVPRTGWYDISTRVEITNTSGSPKAMTLDLNYDNGTRLIRESQTIAASSYSVFRINTKRYLTAGKELYIAFGDNYSAFEVFAGSEFCWSYIGD